MRREERRRGTAERAPARGCDRQARSEELRAGAARPAEMTGVLHEAVADVDHRVRERRQQASGA